MAKEDDINDDKDAMANLNQLVFIVGCGRSGTHFLGHILQSVSRFHVLLEQEPSFSLSTRMALNLNLKPKLLPPLIAYYRSISAECAPSSLVDKNHPNLWLVEELHAAFGSAVFVGIQRNPYATVASMLQHRGVLKWHLNWKDYPVPNPFLGIDSKNASTYQNLPMESKCALRWRSHFDRMRRLSTELPSRLFVVSYEQMLTNSRKHLSEMAEFLRIDHYDDLPEFRTDSLDKWKRDLGHDAVKNIEAIVGFPPESADFS